MSSETNWFYDLTTDDAKEARQHIRVWVGRVLVLLGLLFTTVYYTEAYAAPAYHSTDQAGGKMSLRLYKEPCEPEVMGHVVQKVPPEMRDKFQRAVLTWQGKNYKSCWIEFQGRIHSIDEAGDILQPPLPLSLFKDDTI